MIPFSEALDGALEMIKEGNFDWFKYVPHDMVGEYLMRGWEIADDMAGCHHGNYACLMIWKGEGEPK